MIPQVQELTAIAAWLNKTFEGFDLALAQFANNMHAGALGKVFDWFFPFITFFGDAGWAFIVLGLVMLFFKKTRKCGVAVLLSLIFSLIFTNLGLKKLVARPRPYVDQASFYFQWWKSAGALIESEFSFPSGHTSATAASMFALFFSWGKGKLRYLTLLVTLLIGFSRIYLMVHYASDVIGGLLVGLIAGILASVLTGLLFKRIEKTKTLRA